HRIIDVADPHEPVAADASFEMCVGVRPDLRQLAQISAFDPPRLTDPCTDAAMLTFERDVACPSVVLVLQIVDTIEAPQRHERRLEVSDRALGGTLGLRMRGTCHDGAHAEMPQQSRDLVMQPWFATGA